MDKLRERLAARGIKLPVISEVPPEKDYVYAVDERGRTVLFRLDCEIPGLAEAVRGAADSRD